MARSTWPTYSWAWRGRILPPTGRGDVLLPARQILDFRQGFAQGRGEGKALCRLAVQPVADAHRDSVQIAEYIQFGQRDLCGPLVSTPYRVATRSMGPTRRGRPVLAPVFRSRLPQFLRLRTEHLTDKGPLPYTGGVAFTTPTTRSILAEGRPEPIGA